MIKRKLQNLVGGISMTSRAIKIIVILVAYIVSTAFSFWKLLPNGSVNKVQNETAILNDYISKTGKEIIRCIKEDDREGLNILFCEKARNSDYLNRKIDIVFDFIKENGIVFKNEHWSSPYSHGSTGYGEKTIEWVYGLCENIIIGNKIYNLDFTAYEILKKHQEYEGLLDIHFNEDYDYNKLEGKKLKGVAKDYLGIDLLNINYKYYSWESIISDKTVENDLYLIPDNLEDDR